MEIEEMEFSDVDIDEDAYYESWKDDGRGRFTDALEQSDIKPLIEEFLCELGGYYEGEDDKMFKIMVEYIAQYLNKDVTLTIKPIGEGYSRKLIVEY